MTEFWRRGLSSSQPPTYFITIRHKPRLLGASYWPSGGGSFKKPVRQFKEAFHFFSFFFFAILKRFLKRFLGFIGDSFWNSKWDSGNLFYLCITGCDFFPPNSHQTLATEDSWAMSLWDSLEMPQSLTRAAVNAGEAGLERSSTPATAFPFWRPPGGAWCESAAARRRSAALSSGQWMQHSPGPSPCLDRSLATHQRTTRPASIGSARRSRYLLTPSPAVRFFFIIIFFFFSFFKNILLPRLQKVCARLRKSVRERKKKVAKKKSKIINDNQSAGELRFFSSVAVVNGRWGRRLMMTGRWRWWNNLSDLLKPSAISSSNSGLFDRLLQLLCFPVESNKPISWATVVQTPSVEPSE